MKTILGLFLIVILLVSVLPLADAKDSNKKSSKDRLQEKAKKIERQIDILLIECKQVDYVGAWDYCLRKAYKIQNDRLYEHINPSHKILFETKIMFWEIAAKNS